MFIKYKFPSLEGYGYDLEKDTVYFCPTNLPIEDLGKRSEYAIGWVIYTHDQLRNMALDELPRYKENRNESPFILLETVSRDKPISEYYENVSITEAVESFYAVHKIRPTTLIEITDDTAKKLKKVEIWSV